MGQLQTGDSLASSEQLKAAVVPAIGGVCIAQQGVDLLGDSTLAAQSLGLLGRLTGSRQMIRPGRP
jgi:hypothetical protein